MQFPYSMFINFLFNMEMHFVSTQQFPAYGNTHMKTPAIVEYDRLYLTPYILFEKQISC